MENLEKIIITYETAIELFNKKYTKEGYYISSFLDFTSFNIYFHNLNVNRYLPIRILSHLLIDYNITELIKVFEEVFFDEKNNLLWINEKIKN